MGVSSRGTPPPPPKKAGVGARLAAATKIADSKVEVITPDDTQPPAKRAAAAMGKAAGQAAAAVERPIRLPRIGIPINVGQWIMLGVAGLLFRVSCDTTYAFLVEMFGAAAYSSAVIAQLAFSTIERFHFAGARNGLTWFTWIADSVINAVGLFVALLPAFFGTGVWLFMCRLTGLDPVPPGDTMQAVLALMLGAALAYGGDKALDLAMGR